MIFHEIYGRYYSVVAKILEEACKGTITKERLEELSFQKGFSESVMTIPSSLLDGKWALLDEDFGTPVKRPPELPLTMIQRRWLKTIISDKRIKLFMSDEAINSLDEMLGNVPSLLPDDRDVLVYYDKYNDGDDYENPDYRDNFHKVLKSLRENKLLRVHFIGGKGKEGTYTIKPYQIEYSVKDDKFRVLSKTHPLTVNIGRILDCEVVDDYHKRCRLNARASLSNEENKVQEVELYLTDDRNALERAMIHFSHFEKETERVDETHYRIFLKYCECDETELVIRILSFGPRLKAVAPSDFVAKIKERIDRQLRYMEC